MKRDFVGHGLNPPRVEWPDRARIAVSLTVAYEEGSEHSLLDGDPYRETTGDIVSSLPLDQRDLVNESMLEYGSRVGAWSILDIPDRHQVLGYLLLLWPSLGAQPPGRPRDYPSGTRHMRPWLSLG